MSEQTAEQRRRRIIDDLKHQTGAASFLDMANRTESALIHGLLANDLWPEPSTFNDPPPKNRIRAASTIRNLVRHSAMLATLEELLKVHLSKPTIPLPILLISLISSLQEVEDEKIMEPVCRLCEYIVHKLDALEASKPPQKD